MNNITVEIAKYILFINTYIHTHTRTYTHIHANTHTHIYI